jgi:AraC-like DNA-binding protein
MTPTVSALLCGLIVGISLRDSQSRREYKLKQSALLFYIFNGMTYCGMFLEKFLPGIFTYISPLFFLSFTLFNIYFYYCVLLLTQTEIKQRFSQAHYVLPLVLTILSYVGRLVFLDIDQQAFRLLRHSAEIVFLVGYTSASLRRVYSYFRHINENNISTPYNPARWVRLLMGCSLLAMCSAVVNIASLQTDIASPLWLVLSTFPYYLLHIEIAYHLTSRSFELYILPKSVAPAHRFTGEITVERLENYFRKKKPYLNPQFRMADMVEELQVNRSVLSAFINTTFGVNFNRMVNRWRLVEVKRLATLPSNKDIPLRLLVVRAGFTDMKHYRRAQVQEEQAEQDKQP